MADPFQEALYTRVDRLADLERKGKEKAPDITMEAIILNRKHANSVQPNSLHNIFPNLSSRGSQMGMVLAHPPREMPLEQQDEDMDADWTAAMSHPQPNPLVMLPKMEGFCYGNGNFPF
ncbi:uncharacterized protein EI90DRAFT_3134150 [Cantharellus anzutake]|uniref:uncharacterized protein n=1 Tax=Cantharellus anzutake TaxID=1750568 RepID=UPI001907D8DF|nr:uncharacterized protein EI90DRAFT_3134150 [Cantharellus anzutake]KAF8316922.1 hypothetical protein EI90DRAFT_3134150 [Cantharellus anzutake]